jgi:putative acetyltransferase
VSEPSIRPYRQGDDAQICSVIQKCFEEYGFTWEPDDYNSDTADIQSNYIDRGGWFWVMEDDEQMIATAGLMPENDGACELWRMYLNADYRGKKLGYRLLDFIVAFARDKGFKRMDIWSDVKLIDAHRLYRKYGAEFIGQRLCDDPDRSLENGYIMPL